MSEPLSATEFRDFVELFTEKHGETSAQLETMGKRLDKIDGRLGRIEILLWHGRANDAVNTKDRRSSRAAVLSV